MDGWMDGWMTNLSSKKNNKHACMHIRMIMNKDKEEK